MSRVTSVGLQIVRSSPDEYRNQLRAWSDEAVAAGDVEEVMTDEEIEAEVSERARFFDLSVTRFACLDDGRRLTSEASTITLGGGGAFQEVPQPSPSNVGPRRPRLRDELESTIRALELRGDTVGQWDGLVRALGQAGIMISAEELADLPCSVDIPDELTVPHE